MIELDEPAVEEVEICTCLDRARIALEQTGQHHCAAQMGLLQDEINWYAKRLDVNPNNPIGVLDELYEYTGWGA